MVETIVLKVERRTGKGKRASRKLRAQGMVPAVVYGHKQEPVAVCISYHDLTIEVQHHHRLLDVELDGTRQRLLVKELQYDHLYEKIVHADLTRVDLDERVQVTVPVELRGTPAGVSEGGVLEQARAEVELECVVTNIPESIRVKVASLQIGEMIFARDLELPPGAKLITDPEAPVATVRVLAAEAEEPAAAVEAPAEGTEPEVITREKEAEAGEQSES